jgi:hypothetical protein
VIEVAQEHQPAAVAHERPVGKVDGAHAPQIPVRRDRPEHKAQPRCPARNRAVRRIPGLTRTTLPMWFCGIQSSRCVISRSICALTGGASCEGPAVQPTEP